MKLVSFEPQPDFPKADISEDAAALLEFLMQNREIIATSHTSAEIRFLYRLGHSTLTAAIHGEFENARLQAFSQGFTTYEAISTMVHPSAIHPESPEAATEHVIRARKMLIQKPLDTIVDATDKFREELPRTTRVIGESAARFYAGHGEYVLSGAAVARELEIAATSA